MSSYTVIESHPFVFSELSESEKQWYIGIALDYLHYITETAFEKSDGTTESNISSGLSK
jgi:hypothetical protein